jgi:hypothetical protein
MPYLFHFSFFRFKLRGFGIDIPTNADTSDIGTKIVADYTLLCNLIMLALYQPKISNERMLFQKSFKEQLNIGFGTNFSKNIRKHKTLIKILF